MFHSLYFYRPMQNSTGQLLNWVWNQNCYFWRKKLGKTKPIKYKTPPKKYPFWNEYCEETIRHIAKGPFGGWSSRKGLCIHVYGTFIEPFFPWFFYVQTQTYILASHGCTYNMVCNPNLVAASGCLAFLEFF